MAKANSAKTTEKKKTPCEEGSELLPWTLNVPVSAAIDFTAMICSANARIRLTLQKEDGPPQPLLDETGKSTVEARLPDLEVGRYQLFWSFDTPSDKWQTRAEVKVNSSTRFLRKKTSDGGNPVQMGTVGLKVSAS